MSTALKLFLLASVGFVFACNNDKDNKPVMTETNTRKNIVLPADSMSKEALFVFIADCVAGATKTHGEAPAFALCKCMYEQLRKNNEGIDSTQMQLLQNDTATVRRMLENCR